MGETKDFLRGKAEFLEPSTPESVIMGREVEYRRPGPPGASPEEEARHEVQGCRSPLGGFVQPGNLPGRVQTLRPADPEKRFKLLPAFVFRVATAPATRKAGVDRAEVRALLVGFLVRR